MNGIPVQAEMFETGQGGILRVASMPTAQARENVATGDLERFTSPSSHDVQRVIYYLVQHGWQKAAQIAHALGFGTGEAGKRAVRAIASASGGRIISGQRGLNARCRATDEEILHAVAWLRSQASVMSSRADEIEAMNASVTGKTVRACEPNPIGAGPRAREGVSDE